MKEPKLRKFKLIDREGYINSHACNEELLKDHFVGDTVKGYYIEEWGDITLMVEGYSVISPDEFEFFEEVLT